MRRTGTFVFFVGAVSALLAAGMLSGCPRSDSSAGVAIDPKAREAVLRFGEAIRAGDWDAAYGMTTRHFREKSTRDGLKARWDRVLQKLGADFKPADVACVAGELPKDPVDARERYEINTEPPMDTWRAWATAVLRDGKRAAEVRLLVVDWEGAMRIAYARFEPKG